MPAKSTTKPTTKPAAKGTSKTRSRRRRPTHTEISTRAYFIHLEDGSHDELGNWLRAEHELSAA